MHRTQISLENWQYEMLSRKAAATNKSLSALIRELVDNAFGTPHVEDDPLGAITGIATGDGRAAGREHDHLLYDGRR